MALTDYILNNLNKILIATILILSIFLNFWNLWNEGFSNEYYAAAVRSMLENHGIAFFNSFDAAGFVTVDKPPVGLWVQALSAAVFGFSGWSVALPQALAGVCSVGLLYLLISRSFGKPAGLVAAFALAVTPIFVAVSRNGTMDGQLIFVILLAVFVALKAAEERSLPYLLLSVSLVGIGFNIKMIQAFVVLPAILAIYLLGTGIPFRQKAVHLTVAILVLLIVSLSWAVAVDLTPANQRPYIGNSGGNTVFGLILNYNGLHRLESGGSMPGDGPGFGMVNDTSPMQSRPDQGSWPYYAGIQPPGQRSMASDGIGTGNATRGQMPSSAGMPGGGAPGGMGGGMMGTGMPSPLRLFESDLAGQLSWLIPFALIGLAVWWRQPTSVSMKGLSEAGLFESRGFVLIAMSLWLVPGLLYFSFTTGFWHPYYLATIAPPLAALTGIGAVGMYNEYSGEGRKGWLLVLAVLITGITETVLLNYTAAWAGILIPATLVGTLVATIVLVLLRVRRQRAGCQIQKIIAFGAIALLFLAPFVWACTPLVYGECGILPLAGPQSGQRGGGVPKGFGTGNSGGDVTARLASYLTTHNTGETYLVAVPSGMNGGASLIIETGKPVMALGGFGGMDRILSVSQLPDLIKNHTVRYFLTQRFSGTPGSAGMDMIDAGGTGTGRGSGTDTGGNSDIWAWVQENCSEVPSSEWGSSETRQENRFALYDCAGSG